MESISRALEWVAVGELILAFMVALAGVARELVRGGAAHAAYRRWKTIFGRGILVSLEILVAADLIRTVAVEPTLANVGVLGLIVVVRILLSFSLDVEIDVSCRGARANRAPVTMVTERAERAPRALVASEQQAAAA